MGKNVKLNIKYILNDEETYKGRPQLRTEFMLWVLKNKDEEFEVEAIYFGNYYKLVGESRLFDEKELIFVTE